MEEAEFIYSQYAPQLEACEATAEKAQQEIARLDAAMRETTGEAELEALWAERELAMECLIQADARRMELEDRLYLAVS